MERTHESKLQQLELANANEGQLADVRRSDALTTKSVALEKSYWHDPRLIGSIACISFSTVASYWGFSPPASIITVIDADIGPSDSPSLFTIVWTFCCAISIILFGRISDKFGRRWFLITGSAIGFLGGIIACTAQSMNTLVGANVLLGLAAGIHTCYGLTAGEICPNKYKFLGVVAVVVPNIIPTGFGAYLAQMLVHHQNWRYIYYIYLAIMGFSVILQVVFYRPPSFRQLHGNDRTRMQEVRRIDFGGAFMLIAGLCLFLLGVSWGGQPFPWSSSRILGLLISGGIILFILFPLWEIYSGVPNPLVPMHFFKDLRGFVCLIVIASVSGTIYVAMSIIWPSQVVAIYGAQATSWQSDAWLSTTIAFGIYGGIVLLGPFVAIIKHVRIQLIILMSISVAFLGAMASVNSSNFGRSAAFSFIATFPGGILELIPALMVQMDSNDADLGTVFSIIFCFRTAVGAIMAAIFVAILEAKIPIGIAKYVPQAAIAAGLPQSSLTDLFAAIAKGTPAALEAVPGMTPSILAAVGASLSDGYAYAYQYVYYAAVAVGIVGLIACCCVRDYDKYFTDHVPRQIYKTGNEANPLDEKTDPEYGSDYNSTTKEATMDSHREMAGST